MDTQFYFSKFSSGENSVELVGKGEGYQVIANDAPVLTTESLPDALGKFYKEISAINSAQESGKDLSIYHFGNEVVRLNRMIIPRLAMLGKSKEVAYMKSLTSSLEEAMGYFFRDSVNQKVESLKLWKLVPSSVSALQQPSVNGDELSNQGTSENNVTPRRDDVKTAKKVGFNTIELKEMNPHVIGPKKEEEDSLLKYPIEPATKINKTVQMNNSPKEQKAIDGGGSLAVEPYSIHKSRIEKDEAFELGRDLGVNFDKISLEQWMEGLKVEHEHTDAVGDDHHMIGKIAHAHLKEDPKYYKLLEEYVEKSLRKDFNKMEEGDQIHESIGLNNDANAIGKKQEPLNGEDEKLEKEAFSMDAPQVKNGEKPDPIIQNAFDESKSSGHVDSYSKRENDYQGETGNQTSPPRKIEFDIDPSDEEETKEGSSLKLNKEPYFYKSFDDDEFNQLPIRWVTEDEE